MKRYRGLSFIFGISYSDPEGRHPSKKIFKKFILIYNFFFFIFQKFLQLVYVLTPSDPEGSRHAPPAVQGHPAAAGGEESLPL